MLFNSLSFLIFFPVCLALYMVLPAKARTFILLAASIYFYMCWNPVYVLLLASSILVTYICALILPKCAGKTGSRRIVLACGLIINFGILFVFKYFNFFAETIAKVTGSAGLHLDLLLPVGISFYTFQAVGYLIDVYRGDEPEKNIFRYALFVSFFPQLVAGPIERSGNLLKQIRELDKRPLMNLDDFRKGAFIMLYGYFMKMVIADRAAMLVDTVYDVENYSQYKGFAVLLAAVLFSVQIYCDFAGYTYIAIGAARIMGFKLRENFNTPYLARGIRDFWDRWHISLTGWFRDYLYFPLGGSRKGRTRKYINILIIFLVSGLWHGASWHFVFWGFLNGILRVIEEIVSPIWNTFRSAASDVFFGGKEDDKTYGALSCILTFFIVTVCWMFFRAESIRQAFDLIVNMFSGFGLWQLTDGSLLMLGLDAKEMNVLIIGLIIMILVDRAKHKGVDVPAFFAERSEIVQAFILLIGILFIVIFGIYGMEYDAAAFIYFQF